MSFELLCLPLSSIERNWGQQFAKSNQIVVFYDIYIYRERMQNME